MLSLIFSSAQSILQVMITVLFGYMLTKSGYMTSDKQKWLVKLNIVFFTPCLLFSNIASAISFEKLLAYWAIPFFYVCFSIISFLSSYLVSRVVGVKHEYRPFVIACTMFHNANSLPIAVIASLAVSEAGKFLYWGADDTPQAIAARGITYASFYAIFGNLLRWSYGYSLLKPPTPTEDDHDKEAQRSSDRAVPREDDDYTDDRSIMCRRTSSITLSGTGQNHYKPTETTALLSPFPTLDNKDEPRYDHHSSRRSLQSVVVSTAVTLHESMSPPLYAAFVALIVGLTPPLKYIMYESFLYPTLTSAIQGSAKVSVPITLLTLGSQLSGISLNSSNNDDVVVPTEKETNTKAVATTIGIRMGLIPFIIIPAVVAFLKFGTRWSLVASDPVFGLMMIVIGCTPTAINLVQITQATGAFEKEMLRVLFWSYAVICIPVFTFIIFAALTVVQHFT